MMRSQSVLAQTLDRAGVQVAYCTSSSAETSPLRVFLLGSFRIADVPDAGGGPVRHAHWTDWRTRNAGSNAGQWPEHFGPRLDGGRGAVDGEPVQTWRTAIEHNEYIALMTNEYKDWDEAHQQASGCFDRPHPILAGLWLAVRLDQLPQAPGIGPVHGRDPAGVAGEHCAGRSEVLPRGKFTGNACSEFPGQYVSAHLGPPRRCRHASTTPVRLSAQPAARNANSSEIRRSPWPSLPGRRPVCSA